MIISLATFAFVLVITIALVILMYIVYKNNFFMKYEKPMCNDDNYMDGNTLRTGTYTVDHLKISNIVGE